MIALVQFSFQKEFVSDTHEIGIIGVPHGFNNNDDFDIFPSIFAHDSIDF
jgi:hypothetical protein